MTRDEYMQIMGGARNEGGGSMQDGSEPAYPDAGEYMPPQVYIRDPRPGEREPGTVRNPRPAGSPNIGMVARLRPRGARGQDDDLANYLARPNRTGAAQAGGVVAGAAASAGAGASGQVGGEGRGGDSPSTAENNAGGPNGYGDTGVRGSPLAGSFGFNTMDGLKGAATGFMAGGFPGAAIGLAKGVTYSAAGTPGAPATESERAMENARASVRAQDREQMEGYSANAAQDAAREAAMDAARADFSASERAAAAADAAATGGSSPAGPASDPNGFGAGFGDGEGVAPGGGESRGDGDAGSGGAGGSNSNSGGGGEGGGKGNGDGGNYAKGGRVTRSSLGGPNPKGPDDGYAALDANEYVIRQAMTKKIGFKKLEALNNGKAKIVMIGAKK